MRALPVRAAEPGASALVETVAQTFGGQATLADLLDWAARQVPRVAVAEIVTQDEYTHDVVLPFGEYYLSFDTT
jgi:isopentenyl diphosphate isomerase/L-lactate dehydrogenase-like FMN-dependent dehydrogenase